jgi:hypothetical protein
MASCRFSALLLASGTSPRACRSPHMKRAFPFFAFMLAALLSACGDPTPPADPEGVTNAGETSAPPSDRSYAARPEPGEELPSSQTTPGPIPLAFRHVWAIERMDCTSEPALTRIAIAPGAIRFYEGRSVVTGAESPHENTLILQVDHASEGETSHEVHTLALNDAQDQLAYQRRGRTFTYIRCD